jgi:hypothetical protein
MPKAIDTMMLPAKAVPPKSNLNLKFEMPVAQFEVEHPYLDLAPWVAASDGSKAPTWPATETLWITCGRIMVTTTAQTAQAVTLDLLSAFSPLLAPKPLLPYYKALAFLAEAALKVSKDMVAMQAAYGKFIIPEALNAAGFGTGGVIAPGPVSHKKRAIDLMRHVRDAERPCPCPVRWDSQAWPCDPMRTVGSQVVHLNDYHRWSREKIADWLDALEASGFDLTVHFEDTFEAGAIPQPGYQQIVASADYVTMMWLGAQPISGTFPEDKEKS